MELDLFYNAKDIEEINHIRITLIEKKGPPSLKKILGFNQLVNLCLSFDKRSKIAVHCLHGFNATGFMIVNFLVLERKMTLQEALEVFATARPPGIYKKKYLKALSAIHNSTSQIIFPKRPKWERKVKISKKNIECDIQKPSLERKDDKCFPQEKSIVSSIMKDECSKMSPLAVRKRKSKFEMEDEIQNLEKRPRMEEKVESIKESNIPPSLVKPETRLTNLYFLTPINKKNYEVIQHLIETIQSVLNTTMYAFVGHKHIPVTRKTLERFRKGYYLQTWRTDGIRLLLFIMDHKNIFMIDETHRFYRVENLTFPRPGYKDEYLQNTILDGELVEDIVNNNKSYNYLIFDVYAIENRKVESEGYLERLGFINEGVINPRRGLPSFILEKQPFNIQIKSVSDIQYLKQTWENLRPKIPHEMTGLIFYPYSDISYNNMGRAQVYVWVPSTHKFVRFFLKTRFDKSASKWIGMLYPREKTKLFYEIKYITEEEKNKYDNHVVHCTYNTSNSRWDIIRVDQSFTLPVSLQTLHDNLNDMINPITFEELSKMLQT